LEKLNRAIGGLRDLLQTAESSPATVARAATYDQLSALYLMRAYRTQARSDFQDAVEASEQAVSLAGGDLRSTNDVVIRRNLAAALRGLGQHKRQLGFEEEGMDELRRAGNLYLAAAEAYLAGLRDADTTTATMAAVKSLEEARDVFRALGDEDSAADIVAKIEALSGDLR
jgi:tetratricopeptide (TPR) repeat protein